MKSPFQIVVIVCCFALAGCWQATTTVYESSDFYLPVSADIVAIEDQYGPVGIYKINANNQYVPLFREPKSRKPEKDFRDANLGLVPIDRMLKVFGDRSKWREDRIFSSEIFPETQRLLMITAASRDKGVGQALTISYVEGKVFARCSGAIYDGSAEHGAFMKAHANTELSDGIRKITVTLAATRDITLAKKKGSLSCQRYAITVHPQAALPTLVQSIKTGDRRRTIARERDNAQRKIAAAREAELSAREDGTVYNPDGYYMVSRGAILRLKKGKDRNYRPSYNAYLEVDNGGYPRPYRPGDLVGNAALYRDTQQFNFRNYTFTSRRRCAEFTDPYWAGQMESRTRGVWRLSSNFPSNRRYNGNTCVAYDVKVNSCARVRCSGRLKNVPNNGVTYLVDTKTKAVELFQKLK
jgi:hypothetical protein